MGQLSSNPGRPKKLKQAPAASAAADVVREIPGEYHPRHAEQARQGGDAQGEADIKRHLHFDTEVKQRLCGEYADLDSVKAGLRLGMWVHVPPSKKNVLGSEPTLFAEHYLDQCTEDGIGQMICIPSGGGEKYEVAYLDYRETKEGGMIAPNTPHVRCVFVKPDDLLKYRGRFPDLILVALPAREPEHTKCAKVGDARFWIKAFVTQLRLHAEQRGEAA